MLYLSQGSPDAEIGDDRCREWADDLLDQLGRRRPLRRVLLIPPDYTRAHSGAGPLTCRLYERLRGDSEVAILPAIGTHFPVSDEEREAMFPGIPADRFRAHDWRNGVVTLGEVPAGIVEELSEGKIRLPASVQVDRLLVDADWDAIISVGQLVPHEVIGIANHVKNILVGAGGSDMIHKSHWLGAVYGMERIMGRVRSPVRDLLTWASDHFLRHLPITYLLTVRGTTADGRLVTRGLFAGDDECYARGAALCRAVNLDVLDRAPSKVVVFLDPHEYKSTWLGNKSVYRTRMAIADGGELVVLAPGVRHFGEDEAIDRLIRRFGYRGTPETVAAVRDHPDLAANLSAAAHLIHGSSEGRFRITYCPGPHMTRDEIESVGYGYGHLGEMLDRYPPDRLRTGWNKVDGEDVFFVANPALGLWGTADRFAQ
jgi:nickel-dependent lactate racemase